MHSIPIGRFLGIPLRVSWSVVFAAVGGAAVLALGVLPRLDEELGVAGRLALALTAVALFLFSIVAHEFGHALTARRHGISTSSIRLWIFGGVAALSAPAQSPAAEFQIAIAGPAVNAVLALLFAGVSASFSALSVPDSIVLIPSGLALVNLLLVVTNLVPAAPLDGGRVLTSVIWARTGRPEWARLQSARAGLVLAVAVFGFGAYEVLRWGRPSGIYTVAIAIFLGMAARNEVDTAAIRGRLSATTVGEILAQYPGSIPDRMLLADVDLGPPNRSLPVHRWTHEPIGYLSTATIRAMPPPERSWTTAGATMTPPEMVPRAWTNEPLLDALERHGSDPPQLLGVHPGSLQVVGTATPDQFRHLLVRPDLWGNDRRNGSAAADRVGAWAPTGP